MISERAFRTGFQNGISERDFRNSKIPMLAPHLGRSFVFVWRRFPLVSKLQDFTISLGGLRDLREWSFLNSVKFLTYFLVRRFGVANQFVGFLECRLIFSDHRCPDEKQPSEDKHRKNYQASILHTNAFHLRKLDFILILVTVTSTLCDWTPIVCFRVSITG